MIIEIIATNLEEAILAEQYGANRIELIHNFAEGGLSPNLQLSQAVCNAVKIPVNVMVRPHGRSFCYSHDDIRQIIDEIKFLREHTRANAIVFGALDSSDNVDTKLLETVIEHKGHLGLTFHRAIDVANDTLTAYKAIIKYPEIDLVLTSGGKNTALAGAEVIKQMVELNAPNCKVLAGSGITPDNALSLIKITGVSQIHLGTGARENNKLSATKFKKLISLQNI
jgi:copper homeostasis protein